MKEHKFTSAGASGALAVGQRESGFNPQAINPSGGVAGIFQWSGWGILSMEIGYIPKVQFKEWTCLH